MTNPTPVTIPTRNVDAGVAFAFQAATGSAQTIPWMPGGILLVKNGHATDPKTYSVTSNPLASRDTVTLASESVAAGAYHVAPRWPTQDADTLSITGETTDIEFAVLDTRPQP